MNAHRLFKIGGMTYTYTIKTERGEIAHREEDDLLIDRASYE